MRFKNVGVPTKVLIISVATNPSLIWVHTIDHTTARYNGLLFFFQGGFSGSSESTFVKMPHCWKSHVASNVVVFEGYDESFDLWLSWTCPHGSLKYSIAHVR